MRQINRGVMIFAAFVALTPVAAQAYIGPGIASGAIAAVLGVLGSIFLALFAVIYYPIKRLLKKRKASAAAVKTADAADVGTDQ